MVGHDRRLLRQPAIEHGLGLHRQHRRLFSRLQQLPLNAVHQLRRIERRRMLIFPQQLRLHPQALLQPEASQRHAERAAQAVEQAAQSAPMRT